MDRPDPQTIPETPGVYLYKDAMLRVIYVGKARILRRRVLSYFRHEGLPLKTQAMIRKAASIEFVTTTTEKEAFLLEASLIKKYRPHYNILLRDDKQYAMFRIDVASDFPRLEIVRHARRDSARYFGPYTSAGAAHETWKLLHQAFPLRRCTDRGMKNRSRPCLYASMGQCPAPCTGQADAAAYAENVRRICTILSGHASSLIGQLTEEMNQASENLEFETAALRRDQIKAVKATVERQAVVLPKGGDMDVVSFFAGDGGLALSVLFVRSGAVLDRRSFWFPQLTEEDASDALWSFLGQFYLELLPPPRILLPWIPADVEEDAASAAPDAAEKTGKAETNTARESMEQSLSEKRGASVRIVAPQNAVDTRLVAIARSNASEEARRRALAGTEDVLALVQKALHLPERPERIECVDVSHTGGRQTRVGVVVFEDGAAKKDDYRVYSMPDGDGDDCGTLYAWVARRITSGPPWPSLLLVDGGRGQIAAVMRGLEDAQQPALFPVAGIAKARDLAGHADRRAGNVADRIFLPGRSNPLPLREGGPEILFLQRVRDAAHHFSISSHRRARGRESLSSDILHIPGIGLASVRSLLERFGSVDALLQATPEEIATLPRFSLARARQLVEHLRSIAGQRAEVAGEEESPE